MDHSRRWYREAFPWLLLTMVSLTGLCLYFYDDVLDAFPSHIHAWTQSDRYALALGFLDNGFNLFRPQTYNIFTEGGVTGVDFPIHEYVVALLMKLFGTKEPIVFRTYTLVYSLIAYLFLFRCVLGFTRAGWKAMLAVLFTFTFPIVVYYQVGMVPSATSFASAVIGFSCYLAYLQDQRMRSFYWAVGMLTLAALPRMSCNILLFAVLMQRCFHYFRQGRVVRRELMAFVIAYALIVISGLYKGYLNAEYGSRFLAVLMPASDTGQLLDIVREVVMRWTYQLMSWHHYLVFAVLVGWLVWQASKGRMDRLTQEVLQLAGLLMAGSVIFFVAMARQFVAHEYYFLDSLYPALVLMLMAGLRAVRVEGYVGALIWPALFAGSLIGAVQHANAVQNEKYAETLWDRGEITRKNFLGSDQLLDSLGVAGDARMLVFEAYSTNAPLLLMGRKGYTILNTTPDNIERALALDFDYIVVQDTYLAQVILAYPPLLDQIERIGGNGRISVFAPSENGTPGIPAALGISTPWLVSHVSGTGQDSLSYWSNVTVADTAQTTGWMGVMRAGEEFGPTFAIPFQPQQFDRLLLEGSLRSEEAVTVQVVGSVEAPDDAKAFYRAFPVELHGSPGWTPYACLITPPADMPGGLVMKCYLWNESGVRINYTDLRVTLYRSN